MSGTVSAPMAAPQQQPGAGPGMGQIPPQLLAMLLQARAQQQGAGPAQMQSPGPMQAQMPPVQQQPMQAPQPMPGPQQGVAAPMPGGMSNNYAAQRGRFGDSMMAHMTPGEIAVPPQIQTPQVLQALQSAFKQAGADVRQFAAGSPFAAHNPDTGQQEFSLWSALLPVAGAVVGSIVPGVGTAAGAALGGAAGGAAGGLIDHTGPLGILGGAAGGALGGYMGMGGGLSSVLGTNAADAAAATAGAGAAGAGTAGAAGAGAAGNALTATPLGAGAGLGFNGSTGGIPASLGASIESDLPSAGAGNATGSLTFGSEAWPAARIPSAANVPLGSGAMSPGQASLINSAGNAAASPVTSQELAGLPRATIPLGQRLMGGAYAGLGASMGSALGSSFNTTTGNAQPPGFNNHMPAPNSSLPLGGRPVGASPTFTGYSPYSAVTGSPYSFYPTA